MGKALENIGSDLPDVALCDIGLPGISGIEGVRIMKETYPGLQVLMLTIYDDDERLFQAMCAGACGYLLKKTAPAKLLESLRDVVRRRRSHGTYRKKEKPGSSSLADCVTGFRFCVVIDFSLAAMTRNCVRDRAHRAKPICQLAVVHRSVSVAKLPCGSCSARDSIIVEFAPAGGTLTTEPYPYAESIIPDLGDHPNIATNRANDTDFIVNSHVGITKSYTQTPDRSCQQRMSRAPTANRRARSRHLHHSRSGPGRPRRSDTCDRRSD
jgi:hypothetical protein